MYISSTSSYPDKVDEMIFFQDCSLDNIDIMNTYNDLILQGKYNEANNYINQHDNIYGYFADYFNALENRIYSLQDYLLNKPPKKQPFLYFDEVNEEEEEIEPTDVDKDTIWI
ncbi:MAG: hypothetical protein NC489_18525 [Ruminococcus flavefaciens]|nr:hypothetical protein [Ruminococcus flavefaciens]